jgi:hypothetical protein
MPALDPVYSLTIAILIAFVFAAAGIHKAMNFSHHAGVVADYRVVPAWVVPLLAPLIIVLEFAVVVLVLIPDTRSAGVILTTGLLFVYILSIALNLVRGRTFIDCGCSWGSQGHQISAWLIARNLIMVAVALLALLPSANRSLQLMDWILAALAGTAVIAVYLIGDLLIANGSKLRKLNAAQG